MNTMDFIIAELLYDFARFSHYLLDLGTIKPEYFINFISLLHFTQEPIMHWRYFIILAC